MNPGRDRRLALLVGLFAVVIATFSVTTATSQVGELFPGFLPFVDGSVGNVDQPSWPGVRAGLRYLDQIILADGQPVHDSVAIFEAARRADGRPVHYVLRRGSQTLEIDVAPLPFTWIKLFAALAPLWMMGCLLALLAITIAWIKPSAPFSLPFTLTCLLASCIFFGDIIGTTSLHAWVFAVGFYLLPAALAHLGMTFPETRSLARKQRWLVPAIWAACALEFVVYAVLLGTPHDPSLMLHLFTLAIIAFGALGLILNSLWTLFKSNSDLARTRARLLAIAMAGPLVTLCAMGVAARLHVTIPFNVAAAPLLLFLGAIGFGISNNDVFEVDQVIRRSARNILTIFGGLIAVIILDRALRALFVVLGIDTAYAWAPLLLVIVLVFDRLRGAASWLIERLLYPRAQQMRDTAHQSRTLFSSARSADEMVEILFTQLQRALGLLELALFSSDPAGQGFLLRRSTESWKALPPLKADDPLVLALKHSPRRIGVEELHEGQHARKRSKPDEVKRRVLLLTRMRHIGARLAIPLEVRGELLAILILGQRRGREPYNSLEERLISELATSAALALDDAFAYEKLAAFSRELEGRVEERTRQLNELNGELTRAMQFKSEFIRSVSHELRTPLISVTGFTDLVLERGGIPAQSEDELKKVQRNARSLLVLIEDLLDLGRIEAGQFVLRVAPCELEHVLRDAVAAVEPIARKKGLSLKVELPPFPLLETDANRVRQIMINLLGNAVKFTAAGQVSLRATLGKGERDDLRIEVEDSGPGIPQDQREAIFGEFVQLEQNDSRGHGGTGLGLAIARKLARMLGGDVLLQSEIGRGSTFTLQLPRRGKHPAIDTPVTTPPPVRRRLLTVTEDPELIVRVRDALSADGVEVSMAFDAEEAVRLARRDKPLAIALDPGLLDHEGIRRTLLAGLGETPPAHFFLPSLPIQIDRQLLLDALEKSRV